MPPAAPIPQPLPPVPGSFDAVASVAALKVRTAKIDGERVTTTGFYAPGDLGGGEWFWDAASTTTPNDGTIVQRTGVATGRYRRLFTGGVSPFWFGAKADGSDDYAALQAAITAAPAFGRVVELGAAHYRTNTSLNMTVDPFVTIRGTGYHSQIKGYCAGDPVIDCVGQFGHIFEDFWVEGDSTAKPSCAFLCARTSIASAGLHAFNRVITEGHYTKAGLLTISSESNTYNACVFNVRSDNTDAAAVIDQPEAGMTSPHVTIANPQLGGNTVHKFSNCQFTNYGAGTGGALRAKGIRDISISNPFFTTVGVCAYGIKAVGVQLLQIYGMSGEVASATQGLYVSGTLDQSVVEGRLDARIYGEAGSIINNCRLFGFFSGIPPVDADTITNSVIHTMGLGFRVRTQCWDNVFWGGASQESEVDLGPDQQGNQWMGQRAIFGGPYHITHFSEGSLSRLQTTQIKANVIQTRMQIYAAPLASGTITPNVRSGGLIYVELDRNVTIALPPDMIFAPGNAFDEGAEVTFVFKQDATGGRKVTFDPTYFFTDWQPTVAPNSPTVGARTPTRAPNGIDTITFRLTDVGYVQVASYDGGLPGEANAARFGAVGDLTVDSTAAFTAAIAAADQANQGLGNGGTVFVPPGNYKITNELVLPKGVRLCGVGALATTITQTTVGKSVVVISAGGDRACVDNIRLFGAARADVVRVEALTATAIDRPRFTGCIFDAQLVSGNQIYTVDNTTDVFTANTHGLSNGDRVMFTNDVSAATMPAPLDNRTEYFVINATTNTFKVSLTSGGAGLDITTNGSNNNYVAGMRACLGLYPTAADIIAPEIIDCKMTGAAGGVAQQGLVGLRVLKTGVAAGGVPGLRMAGGAITSCRIGIRDNKSSQKLLQGVAFDTASDRCGGGGTYIKEESGCDGTLATVRFDATVTAADYAFDLTGTNGRFVGQFGARQGLVTRGNNSIVGYDGTTVNENVEYLPTRFAGQVSLDSVQQKLGTAVASANDLDPTHDGNVFVVTGTTDCRFMYYDHGTPWRQGTVIRLYVAGGVTLRHNFTSPGAGRAPFFLRGAVDYVAPIGEVLTFQLLGTGLSSTRWQEVGRLGGTGENPLTFSSGLTRTVDTITNDVITGKAGGQTWTGGTAASENLIIRSTSNGTKGTTSIGASDLVIDEVNHRLGVNMTPTHALSVSAPSGVTFTSIDWYNLDATAANRNWSGVSNFSAFGDFAWVVSASQGANPLAGAAVWRITPAQHFTVAKRMWAPKGADVASAGDLVLTGNSQVVTGTTTINAITTTDWAAGAEVILLFSGACTVNHNTAGGASTARIFLAGSAPLTTAANTLLKLWYDGTQWQEVSRKVA